MLDVLCILFILGVYDLSLFYLTEKYYCKKYLFKNRVGCKCWSCRFYSKCRYVKRGDNNDK